MPVPRNASNELTHWADKLYNRFWKWMQNPDKTLQDNAGTHGWQDIELYNEMLRRDSQLSMLFRKRANAVVSLEYQIEAGGDTPRHIEQRDFIQANFDELEESGAFAVSRATSLSAVAYGYRPAELIYDIVDGKLVLKAIKNRDPGRFRFNDQDQLVYVGKLLTKTEVLDPWKFMRNTWGSDESPYGHGLLREVYPLWFFKTVALKDFTRYLEKMGTGWVVGTYPMGTPVDEIDNFMALMEEMQSNNVGAAPEGSNIEFKQGQHTGVKDIFSWIISEYVDKQYTLAILEQTTSTETESGTHALGRFQSMGEQRVIEADAKWQQAEINQSIIRPLIDFNFGPMPRGEYPRFSYSYEPDKDRKTIAEAIKVMVDAGMEITKGWAHRECGLPEPEDPDALLEKSKPLDPFGGGQFPGMGDGGNNEPPPDADETEDPENPGDLKESSAALRLAESKKKDASVVLRIQVHDDLAKKALDTGLDIYEKRQRELVRSLKRNATLTEVINVWKPPPAPEYLIAHHRDVIATSELMSLSLMTQEAKDRGMADWLAGQGIQTDFDWAKQTERLKGAVNPMEPGEAWRFFKDKVPMTRRAFDARQDIWHDKAFTIAGLDNEWAAARIKKAAENALAAGTLMDDWVREADMLFSEAGLTSTSAWHLETVYRTNVQGAVNAARYRALQSDTGPIAEFFPDLEYVTAGDDAVRDEHAALNGLIFPRNHGFWAKYYPPNGFNCRCIALERTAIEKQRGDYEPQAAIPTENNGLKVEQPRQGFDRPPTEMSENYDLILLEDAA